MADALLVDDDVSFQAALAELVRAEGFSVETAASLSEARTYLGEHTPDVALVDLKLPDGSGLDLLRESDGQVATEIVVIAGNASVDSAVEALRSGASDYLTKPVDIPRLKSVLANVVRRRELREEIEALRGTLRTLGHFGPLIGASPAMQAVYDMIARVAPTEATVLVQGESGTGKELVAQTLHQLSRRRKGPFVALNCAAVSPNLIESELFGHERGSFTGAARTHKGFFERAEGGTLLDRKSTRLNSSHDQTSYAVFCLKKKNSTIRLDAPLTILSCQISKTCSIEMSSPTFLPAVACMSSTWTLPSATQLTTAALPSYST